MSTMYTQVNTTCTNTVNDEKYDTSTLRFIYNSNPLTLHIFHGTSVAVQRVTAILLYLYCELSNSNVDQRVYNLMSTTECHRQSICNFVACYKKKLILQKKI